MSHLYTRDKIYKQNEEVLSYVNMILFTATLVISIVIKKGCCNYWKKIKL